MVTRIEEGPQVNGDATAPVLAEVFGLAGFEVLAAADAGGELELMIETPAGPVPCPGCGAGATAKDRRPTWVAALPIAGARWCCAGSSGSGPANSSAVSGGRGPRPM